MYGNLRYNASNSVPGQAAVLLSLVLSGLLTAQTISPSSYWKTDIVFPYDSLCSRSLSKDSVRWIKFSILLDPHDPNVVYFQDSREYLFHYDFASHHLNPFFDMTSPQFNSVALFEQNQQAILGTVILPPATQDSQTPDYLEYGIQFVRQDPFTREQIRDLFNLVKAHVDAPQEVMAFYFPTYEQQATAKADGEWFEQQGIALGSTDRWIQGNTCYSEGWTLGPLKFFSVDEIELAYFEGRLTAYDVLLTDGIPAELPYVAGIISLASSTPNSHVAILAETYAVPFVHLARDADASLAQSLVGRRIVFSGYRDQFGACKTQLIDTHDLLDDTSVADMLALKDVPPLEISPIQLCGQYAISTQNLTPADIQFVGGKAANFGILRQAIPDNSPVSMALTFDVWHAFMAQWLSPVPPLTLASGEYLVLWADEKEGWGPTHLGFKLDRQGESLALTDTDGMTLIDSITFDQQDEDVSYGRVPDAPDMWQSFSTPTPGYSNARQTPVSGHGLVINEFMADNETCLEDPDHPDRFPDWIEIHNASDHTMTLNGMYLTDDMNDLTKWRIPLAVAPETLGQSILRRLSSYTTYPPDDMQPLATDLTAIQNMILDSEVTRFNEALRSELLVSLHDPDTGFDPNTSLRFRSSTNVEDSEYFSGAGLYDSFSGCLANALDGETMASYPGDPCQPPVRSVFRAIRRTLASFYNTNAFLERLRHGVNEAEMGMGLLVHHAFPDDIELANGVATVQRQGPQDSTIIHLVTQQGAVSVTHPEDAAIPEELFITVLPTNNIVIPRVQHPSNLVPMGATVMTWRSDYQTLTELLIQVSDTFAEVTGKTHYVLDLEYKKLAPGGQVLPMGGLVIKQVRQVPTPDQTRSQTPFLINVPMEFEVFPGEFEFMGPTDVFADHRLKSRWTLETKNTTLGANTLTQTLYGTLGLEYVDGNQFRSLTEDMTLLPSASHNTHAAGTTDAWTMPNTENAGTYHLKTTDIPTTLPISENPILTLADLGTHGCNIPYKCLTLDVLYNHPVASWFQHLLPSDPPSGLSHTITNRVYLWPRQMPCEGDILQNRMVSVNGVTIITSFTYPPPPTGYPNWSAHTAPLKCWRQTTIEGLTTDPIILKSYYSQTYRPEHHNMIENFLFEPRLETNASQAQLQQLQARNIRLIHVTLDNHEGNQSAIRTYGFD